MKKIYLAPIMGVVLMISGCATGPWLDRLPRRDIDRPYTLPANVDTWHIPSVLAASQDPFGNTNFDYPVPVPLFWQESLGDDWELEWAPIPLGVKHQFNYDDTGYLGAGLNLGIGYGSYEGGIFTPNPYANYRRKLNKDFALDVDAGVSLYYQTQNSAGSQWSGSLDLTALYQFTDVAAVRFGPGLQLANSNVYSENFFTGETSTTSSLFQASMPLNFEILWSISRRWDFDLTYRGDFIGLKNGAYDHLLLIDFIYYW